MNQRRDKLLRTAALWTLPVVLWLVATGWRGFDLGKFSDDWAVSLRTPETGRYQWPASPFVRWNYFWRPLHLLAVCGLGTAFWSHDWVNHVVSALAHLGVGVLTAVVLRRLGARSAVAAVGAAGVLLFPLNQEAVLWPSALGSVVGTGVLLAGVLLCIRFARREADGRPWWALAGVAALAFLSACWHEQPAACFAALPMVYLACRTIGQGRREALGRSALLGAACVAGCAAYATLLMLTAPAGRRGSVENIAGAGVSDGRLGTVIGQAADWLLGSRAIDGVIGPGVVGWVEIVLSNNIPFMAGIAAGMGGWAWLWWRSRPSKTHEQRDADGVDPNAAVRVEWLIVFGALAAAASLLPVAMTRGNPVHARYLYPASVCVSIGAGVLVDRLLRRVGRTSGRVRWALLGMIGATACGVLLFWTGAWVDWQRTYQERAKADMRIARGLRDEAPHPPRGAVFVPVAINERSVELARMYPLGRAPSALAQPWSCWAFVQRAYGRSDITATFGRPGRGPRCVVEGEGLRFAPLVCDSWGRVDPTRAWVPWERLVFFEIDAAGDVHSLTREDALRRLRR